jgi:hypothetical protein
MKVTRSQIRRIILEYYENMLAKGHMDGSPWSGTLEDLASLQGKTWGGGSVIDPKAWKEDIKMGGRWTSGTAKAISKRVIREHIDASTIQDLLGELPDEELQQLMTQFMTPAGGEEADAEGDLELPEMEVDEEEMQQQMDDMLSNNPQAVEDFMSTSPAALDIITGAVEDNEDLGELVGNVVGGALNWDSQSEAVTRGNIIKESSSFAATAQEEAEKINSQAGISLVTDQSYWENMGISTGEELAFSILHQEYSDAYKSLHGIRPRWVKFETVEQIQQALKDLDREYEIMAADDKWNAERDAEWEKERQELAMLQVPGIDLEYDQVPHHQGMGRRASGSKSQRRMENINARSLSENKKSLADILFEKAGGKTAGADLESAFKGGPEGVRAFMDSKKDEAVIDVLSKAAAEYDGSAEDDQIAIGGAQPIDVQSLGPTQQFIDLMQSVSFPLGSADELESAITSQTSGAPGAISISGNAVLDGHHRWSGVFAITPDGNIKAKNFEFPGSVKEKLAAAQMAVAAVKDTPGQPSKGGGAATDIIGKGKDEIVKMIDANKGKQTDQHAPGPLLNDSMIKSIADGNHPAINAWAGIPEDAEFISVSDSEAGFANDPIRKAIAEKVGGNLASLPSPLAGAPESREDMPQLDHPDIGGKEGLSKIEKGLPAGEFNVVPPFTKDDQVLERWQRLAGLLKG